MPCKTIRYTEAFIIKIGREGGQTEKGNVHFYHYCAVYIQAFEGLLRTPAFAYDHLERELSSSLV